MSNEQEYRFLSAGEKIQKNDEIGDAWGSWAKVGPSINCTVLSHEVGNFRRPIKQTPAEQQKYRLLEPGEVIQEGDEWKNELSEDSTKWEKANLICPNDLTYRRPIKEQPTLTPEQEAIVEAFKAKRRLQCLYLKFRIKPEEHQFTAEQKAIIEAWEADKTVQYASACGAIWFDAKRTPETTIFPLGWKERFKTGLWRIKPETPQPGEGWRFLEVGEVIEKGKVSGKFSVYRRPKPKVEKFIARLVEEIEQGAGFKTVLPADYHEAWNALGVQPLIEPKNPTIKITLTRPIKEEELPWVFALPLSNPKDIICWHRDEMPKEHWPAHIQDWIKRDQKWTTDNITFHPLTVTEEFSIEELEKRFGVKVEVSK